MHMGQRISREHRPFNFYPLDYENRTGDAVVIKPADTRPFTCLEGSGTRDFWVGDTAMNVIISEMCSQHNQEYKNVRAEVFLAEQMLPNDWQGVYFDFRPNDWNNTSTMRRTIGEFLAGKSSRTRSVTPGVSKRYARAQIFFVPINTGNHWTMGIVDCRTSSVLYVNTATGQEDLKLIEEILKAVGGTLKGTSIHHFTFLNLSPFAPQQTDGWTCGYHAIRYADMFLKSATTLHSTRLETHVATVFECNDYRQFLAELLNSIMLKAMKKLVVSVD